MQTATDNRIQVLANITKTWHKSASSHRCKAAHNESRAILLREELEGEGVKIPDINDLLKAGHFNGDGSW